MRWFLISYFNDILAGIFISAYTNLCLSYISMSLTSLWKIEVFVVGCGFVWELLAPFFKSTAVTDFWDLIAYMFGGLIFWFIQARLKKV